MKLQLARAQALLNQSKPNPDEAMKVLQPLVNRKNAPWPVFHYSGIAFLQKKEYATALSFFLESVRQGADAAETHHSISICYFNLGSYDEAEEHATIALEKKPEFFKGWLHLGSLYRAQAKLDEALKCYQKANALDPKSAGVAYRIGEIYNDQGDMNKAYELYSIATKIDEEYTTAWLAMSQVERHRKNYDNAEECINKVLNKNPKNLAARVELAEHFKHIGNYDKAIELYEQLVPEFPNTGGVRVNYALCLQELGRFEESEKHYMIAFERQPDSFESLSNYLMGVHYNPERTKDEIFEAHKLWDKHFAPKEKPERPVPFDTSREKKLRVGFISGGFRTHPVGWMITKALENLPKDQFETYCYTTNNKYDKITRRIHRATDKWQSVIGYSDAVIARMIREDELDILVELSGHSADTRLKTVVMEPAPIIIKWVGGLFNTTGLKSVDYLITDHYETPAGEEEYYTEKLIRMPDDYVTFLPPDYAPEVESLPAKKNGYITFGCFNNPTKVNDEILVKWAGIMNRVPESQLFLKSKQYDTKALKDRIIETMKGCGIDEGRLRFEGLSPHEELLGRYNEVDIALDPWPYSGGLTTCEALWMGVPVVTKPGPTFAGRHSTTHLINAGLPELVVDLWEEYEEKVVELVSDTDHLANLRAKLRSKVENSPVVDGQRYGAHLSRAFRAAWYQWVDGFEKGEDNWQKHIDVEPLNDEQIHHNSKVKEQNLKADDAVMIDFIKKDKNGAAKINGSSINGIHTNGSVNGHHKNGTSAKSEEKPETFKIETRDGVTICTPADTELLTPHVLLEQKQWYENELEFVRDYVKPGMTFLDVGAGFGVYSLPVAKLVGDKGHVFAFEPGSVAKHHLEMSKLENGFGQLEVIGKAISDKNGKQNWLTGKTPELDRVDDSGKEKVSSVTLDAWWQFEGEPAIDVIKVDVNGNEANVLSGATDLIEKESPVILLSITDNGADVFADTLANAGYSLFEYIPGPGLLTGHDREAGSDPYMQNLVAVKDDRLESLKENGWLHDESVDSPEVDSDLWKSELSKLPWAESMMETWENQDSTGRNKSYLQALNYLVAAEQIDVRNSDFKQPRSQKAVLLLGAAQVLINLYNQGANSTSIVFTLVRTLNALGKRSQAVEVMQKLVETTKLGQENMNVDLPFMLPVSEQDHSPIKTEFNKWLMVKTIEAWILLKDVSTWFSGAQERKLIEVLDGNPEVIDSLKSQVEKNQNGHSAELTSQAVKTKELLFITTDFPPYDGGRVGHSIRAYTLANFFAENDYKVHLVILQEMIADREAPYMHENIEIVNYSYRNVKKALNKDLDLTAFCTYYVQKFNIDTIVTSSPPITSHLIAQKIKAKFGNKIYWICDIRDIISVHPVTRQKNEADSRRQKQLEIGLMGSADAVTTVASGMRETIFDIHDELDLPLNKDKFTIIENGFIEKRCVNPQEEVIDFVEKSRKENRVVLFYAGTGTVTGEKSFEKGNKDLTFLFELFSEHPELSKHFSFLIQGKVMINRSYLENLNLKLNYQFLPPVTNEQMLANLRLADLGVNINLDRVQAPGILGGKLYDYISCEMGLLLIFPDNATSLFDFAAKHDNKPYFADIFDEASILETLNEIVESKSELGERKFNKSEVQQYNRYVQYKKFLKLIREKPGKDESTPSAVVSKTIRAHNGDEFKIAIPGKELFRLKNIFIDNEYALPDGFGFPENPVIIDVGANVGSFALYASTWSNNCKIHCFEPNPQVLPLLEKNIKPVDAVVHPIALSNKDEVLKLWQHPDSTGGASVTKSSDRGNLVEVSAFNALPYLSNIGVEEIDVLKIDTEGSEIDILRSLEEILPKVRLIMLEYHSEEDRVEIESMLTEFELVDEIIARKHLGTLKFLNPKLPLSL